MNVTSPFGFFINCASLWRIPEDDFFWWWFCIVASSKCGLVSPQIVLPALIALFEEVVGEIEAPGSLSQSASDHTWPTDCKSNRRSRNNVKFCIFDTFSLLWHLHTSQNTWRRRAQLLIAIHDFLFWLLYVSRIGLLDCLIFSLQWK